MKLRPLKHYRVHLARSVFSNVGDLSWSWIRKDFIQVQESSEIRRRMFTSSIKRRISRFHVVVVQWTTKKCTRKRERGGGARGGG